MRVLDPAALDVATGRHGRMTIELSAVELGRSVAIPVPRRLVCARCDGGGCDACDRSGALKLDLDDAERTTQLVLPAEGSERLLVRLVRPFDEATNLEQLTVEIRLLPAPPTVREWRYVVIALLVAAIALAAVFAR